MINFVEVVLSDPCYLQAHEDLDAMLAEGWEIIGHAVYINDSEPTERYTLHKQKAESSAKKSLISRLENAQTSEEKEAAYLHLGKYIVAEANS